MAAIPRRIDLPVPYPVLLKSALNSGRGQLVNVSSDGVHVATPMLLLPQAQVSMLVILPEMKPVKAEAIVTWENRGTVRRGAYRRAMACASSGSPRRPRTKSGSS